MAKKELRLAVVIYGGASLAVYMHGVTKELLKLIRASKVLHEMGPEAQRQSYQDGPDPRPCDTETIYFEILKEINRKSHFRVVIDVMAGASAGAINAVMLAKALVDDALLGAQTIGWLRDADTEQLSAQKASRLRKWYLYPFLRALSLWLPRDVGSDAETREKITRLVRQSWFRPPFSGGRLCHHFFDALEAMMDSRREGSSLLPPGQRLDVYASITDLFGYPRAIQLNEKLVAREVEHAAYCQLTHISGEPNGPPSDFRDDNLPALVWAARASSSYAGAFPPFHHREIQRVLEERGRHWPDEDCFLQHSVRARDGSPARDHFDPADRYFVDGGIVNNKPFRAALEALNHRPADRQVERCLVYVEPDPTIQDVTDPARNFGYVATIRAALSSIPRNQPILDELHEVMAQDARVQVNRRIIEANRAEIEGMVADLQAVHARQPLTAELIGYLRAAMADRAEITMGLAYHVYVQRRVWRLVEALVRLWRDRAGLADERALSAAMEQSVAGWWYVDGEEEPLRPPASRRGNRQQAFLDLFDVSYRIRRLQFLIRRINQYDDDPALEENVHEALDRLKQRAYDLMARCYPLRRSEGLDERLMAQLLEASQRLPLPPADAVKLLERVGESLHLSALDRALDRALFDFLQHIDDRRLRDALLGDYVGFPVYDVILLAPGSLEGGPDPLTPIRIERVSPADAPSLRKLFRGLRCRDFMGFVGFFNRSYREHDYLWGRLNAAERLVDLLTAAAGGAIADPAALKHRLFLAIVERERERLTRSGGELDRISSYLTGDVATAADAVDVPSSSGA